MRTISPSEFWSKVDFTENCWVWLGARNRRGYGTHNARSWAHRTSWEWTNGRSVPKGFVVCHACDNPTCVNPDHLWLGTQGDNVRDAVQKGRLKPALVQPLAQAEASAWRRQKTHCVQGHEYTPENTMPQRSGTDRKCRTCANAVCLRSYYKRKQRVEA